MRQKNKGFTLIELLVVVAIIGILAAVGVVAYNGYTGAAKKASIKTIHAQTLKYIAAESQKCSLGEATLMGTLSCTNLTAQKIVSHIGSAGGVLSDKNPFDTANTAIKAAGGFVLGQVSLSAANPVITLNTCIEATCNTDAKKMIATVTIE